MMSNRLRVSLVAAVLGGMSAGCEMHHRDEPRAVVVEPGYYYDREYYDADHHFHPRVWYYYDGHGYVRHDAPPHDAVIRERLVHEDADMHDRDHDRDHAVPGERLHDDVGPADRAGELPPHDR